MSDAPRVMRQEAPWPEELGKLVGALRFRQHLGWSVYLADDLQRDKPGRHSGESRGLTLVVVRQGPNTYDPSEVMRVAHYFPVPPATYNRQSWTRWLFDRLGDVDDHERMEDFAFATDVCNHARLVPARPCGPDCPGSLARPYAPNHGPGWDPYLVTVESTGLDRRTAYTGDVNPR